MLTKVRIGDFLHRKRIPAEIDPDKEYSLVTVKLHHKGVVLRGTKNGSQFKSKMYKVSKDDFILSGIDARNGAFGIIPEELDGALVTNDVWYFDVDETKVKKDFFYWLTTTPLFLDACQKSSKGETQRIRLQKNAFFNFEFHFPPINEQEEFLKKLSVIEGTLTELNTENRNQYYYLAKLRQAILQEAIEGKLTADWRKENPVRKGDPDYDAEALLEKIKAEKEKLIAEGKIKKQKPLSPIKPEEVPFELPEGWVWTRLGEITQSITDGDHQPPPKRERGIPFLVISNVSSGYLDFKNTRFVAEEYYNNLVYERKPMKGDILYTVTGSYGIPILIEEDVRFCIQRHIGIIRGFEDFYKPLLVYFLCSTVCKSQADKTAWRVAVKTVSLNSLRNFYIPLPPFKEQHIIVKRVDKLLNIAVCLEKQIYKRKEHADSLMQTVLREAFEIS